MSKKKQLSPAQIETLRTHQFKRGQIANPHGRPKNKRLTAAIVRGIEKSSGDGRTVAEDIADALIDQCRDGNTSAIALLWDRTEGKVAQALSVSATFHGLRRGPDTYSLDDFDAMTPEQVTRFILKCTEVVERAKGNHNGIGEHES